MDGKFIVFFRHRDVRKAIEKKLVTMKLKYICIAGDVPSDIRAVCLTRSLVVCSVRCTLDSGTLNEVPRD